MAPVLEKVPEDTRCLLYSLFISNVPQSVKDEWKTNFVRIFAELEWAHWFYLDNCLNDSKQAGVDFFGFCQQMFERFPHLLPKKTQWKEKFFEWKRYRGTTSSGSAIILDECLSMVLLVQGFGGTSDRWTFPGGKVNQHETLKHCAIREVMEETGLDIEHRLDPNLYLDTMTGETKRRAYIIEGFPRTTRLQPSTQNEIEAITWFNLSNLPASLQDETSMKTMHLKPNIFFCVVPFVKQLRRFVKLRRDGYSPAEALNIASSASSSSETRSQSMAVTKRSSGYHTIASSPSLLPPVALECISSDRVQSIDRKTPSKKTRRNNRQRQDKRSTSSKPPLLPTGSTPSAMVGHRPCDFRHSSITATRSSISFSQNTTGAPLLNKGMHHVQSVNMLFNPAPITSTPYSLNEGLNFLRISNVNDSSIWGGTIGLDADAFLHHFAPISAI